METLERNVCSRRRADCSLHVVARYQSGDFDLLVDLCFFVSAGFEFVFHVSTFMDATKQRQHIGNDTVLLFYKQGPEKVEQSFRGKVNACALLLYPSEKQGNKSITMSAFFRRWIDGFVPVLPHRAVSIAQPAMLREILFTNIVNCCYAAVKSGPYKQNRR